MATGASNSDAAVILIDARKGVLTQTRRHSYICSLLGIRHVVVAVNKIDLVDFSGERFHHIVGDYLGFAQALDFASITPIPRVGPLRRQRHAALRANCAGSTAHAAGVSGEPGCRARRSIDKPFRFPVQWVNRPNLDFRGFSGTVASGQRPQRRAASSSPPRARSRTIARIVTADGDLPEAQRR